MVSTEEWQNKLEAAIRSKVRDEIDANHTPANDADWDWFARRAWVAAAGAAEDYRAEFGPQAISDQLAIEIAKDEIGEQKRLALLGKFNGVYEDFAQGLVANRKGKMAREQVIDLARPCIQIAEDVRKENPDRAIRFDEFIAYVKDQVRRAI
jgi:hypothetical protein